MLVTIKSINGKSAQFHIKDKNEHIQRCWNSGRFYESHKNSILAYLMQNKERYQNKTCLDIGASIGNHTVYFSKILNCKVTSFEPVLSSFLHLKENCELNNIDPTLHNIGLGEKKGKVGVRNNSKAHYNVGMFQIIDGDDIEIDALDNVFEGQVDFIKIDVEHYNIPLLLGAKEVLRSQNKCDVFIECESKEIFDSTNNIMQSYGYKLVKNVVLNHTPTYLWRKIQKSS